jgi:hypothetical protein
VVLTIDPTVCPGDLSNTEPLRIGNHATPDVEAFYHGIIDEVSLYHRALSSNEIASIYRAGSAGKCPVAPPTCVSPPSGLVGWWPGEGNANDNVGLNNGLLENVAFANGKVGQAFYLNGSDADVKIPASSSLDVGSGDGFTLEAWINPSDVSQRYPLFEWNVGDGTTYWGVHFYIDPVSFGAGPGALYANIVDNYGSWHQLHTDAGVVATNVFQHVALTYDKASGVATIYCNGVAVAQQNLGSFTPLTTYDLYLGKRPLTQGETYAFAGLLDEPSVYNRALSPTEIASIYQAGSAGKCAESVPPAITVQPVNQTTVEGSNVVLSVVVGGTGPFSYQWCFTTNTAFITDPLIHLFFNGTNIPGATNATLTLTNLHPYQSGCYAVTITTPSGIIASSGASVTVIARNILVYNYSGTEKITTAGQAFAYAYSGQMFFIPDSTSGAFVGWGTINGEKQYWVNSLSDYLLIAIPGATNQTITILGRAGQEIDADSCPHIWSYLHKGQNTQLTIGAKKYFSFPNTFRGEAIHVYPDSQTGNPILNESSSKYTFAPQNTQTANNNGQTLTDLIGTLTNTLASQGYQKQ